MRPLTIIPIAYGIVTTIILIKWKLTQVIDEFSEADVVRVKVWYQGRKYEYDRQSRILFIGGVPRSGTTMLRSMVEGHPSITCGEETGVIPGLMKKFGVPMESHVRTFLTVTGVTQDIIDDNIAEFILKILTKHSRPNLILCNKDPIILNHTVDLHRLFPNSKHLLIVRDGRASVSSIIKYNVLEAIFGSGVKTFESGLIAWNITISNMVTQCLTVGPETCMILYYELLVNDPVHWLKRVASFINVPYIDTMFNYRSLIGDKFDVFVIGSSNITRDISNKSFYNWVDDIPSEVSTKIRQIVPMLEILGYDIENACPDYGTEKLLKGYLNMTRWRSDSFKG